MATRNKSEDEGAGYPVCEVKLVDVPEFVPGAAGYFVLLFSFLLMKMGRKPERLGEICVRGDSVIQSYFKNPQLTQTRLKVSAGQITRNNYVKAWLVSH